MAHLWRTDPDGGWSRDTLDAASFVRSGSDWVIVGDASVRVNGAALILGIHVLRDRDELLVAGERVWFSSESPAVIASFDGAAAILCPRCRLAIDPGTPSVVCPCCRVVYHQIAVERPCWTYAPTCATCSHATSPDAGPRWTPEAL